MRTRGRPLRRRALRRHAGRLSLVLAVALAAAAATAAHVEAQVPDPESHFGHPLGADRRLAGWDELVSWYDAAGAISDRMRVDTVGTTTEGRPFIVATITSARNQARLARLREVQQTLADPRRISSSTLRDQLLDEGRAVVLITHGIHSTEVGSTQAAARLAHRLATSDEPSVARILDETIVVQIPSQNPDGTQWITDWYEQWVGTPYEAAPLPWLYHSYVGHDNNRDWYAFTQKETQLVVEYGHNAWRPQVVHDVHQMGGGGARIFLPPYIDPWEPNVDPALTAAVNRLGMAVASELIGQGREGVVVNAIYDAFSPARAYSHYHGGARILSETASAMLASPMDIPGETVRGGRAYDAAVSSWNHPVPWRGGRWGLPEIVDHMESSAFALLEEVARDRRGWLETSHGIAQRAVEGWDEWPAAWVVPSPATGSSGQAGVDYLLHALTTADVEVRRTSAPTRIDGIDLPAGSWVVPMQQPYAGFAQALLERQRYPDLREYPGGPPRRPYDVTAHTLPLLFGVDAFAVNASPAVPLSEPISSVPLALPSAEDWFEGPAPTIGYYKSRQEPMEGGWTRWVFDQTELPYDTILDADVRAGRLQDLDVFLLQDQSLRSIRDGIPEGRLPAAWTGGLGDEGARAVRDFVRNGGRLVAIEGATDFAIDLFDLQIGNAVERLPPENFFIPGSLLSLDFEPGRFSEGLPERDVAWFWGSSRAFEIRDPSARVLARYGGEDLLASGWMLGGDLIAGRPALVEIPVGRGSVVLFGYQPNYRAQTVTGWQHLMRALDPARSALRLIGDADAGAGEFPNPNDISKHK